MTKAEAHLLLDQAKAGKFFPESVIIEALIATGDICHSWPERE